MVLVQHIFTQTSMIGKLVDGLFFTQTFLQDPEIDYQEMRIG
jgi:hypothetical protein